MPMIPTILQSLNTAVLSDTLDSLGLMQQAMKPFIRPLDHTLQLFGRARTGLYMPVYAPPAPGENPYEVEIALVDGLAPGEVVVLACDGPTEASRLGRTPLHRQHGAWRGRMRDRRPRTRREADPRYAISSVLRRHRATRYQGSRANGRSRRPGDVRRCERASGRHRLRRCRWCGRHPARRGAGSRPPCSGKDSGENQSREALQQGEKLADVFRGREL